MIEKFYVERYLVTCVVLETESQEELTRKIKDLKNEEWTVRSDRIKIYPVEDSCSSCEGCRGCGDNC